MKHKTYKLRDLQYASLSLTYLGLIAGALFITLITAAVTSSGGNWVGLFFSLFIGLIVTYYIYYIGIRYGQYGLIILLAKVFQPRHIKNDFPLFAKQLVQKEHKLLTET